MDDIIDMLPIETAVKLSEATPPTILAAPHPSTISSEISSSRFGAHEVLKNVSSRSLSEAHEFSHNAPNELPKDCQTVTVLEQAPSSASGNSSNKTVRWNIYWKQPVFMIGLGLFGLLLALGHHMYYSRLHGNLASTPENQDVCWKEDWVVHGYAINC